MKNGPILIFEDDSDDQSMLVEIFQELGIENKLIFFDDAKAGFKYLKSTTEQPFLILCDVNLPGKKGTDFKRDIDQDPELRRKSIPFIFHSTSVNQETVNEAYTELTVQGFFQKDDMYESIRENMRLIVGYWKACKHPNTF